MKYLPLMIPFLLALTSCRQIRDIGTYEYQITCQENRVTLKNIRAPHQKFTLIINSLVSNIKGKVGLIWFKNKDGKRTPYQAKTQKRASVVIRKNLPAGTYHLGLWFRPQGKYIIRTYQFTCR
jgi:hypothetical protein